MEAQTPRGHCNPRSKGARGLAANCARVRRAPACRFDARNGAMPCRGFRTIWDVELGKTMDNAAFRSACNSIPYYHHVLHLACWNPA
jgi:hypothetical protein